MGNFEIVIFLMTILIVLSAFADKIKLPYPVLLVVIGLVIGFLPFLPNLQLDSDIVFLIFLPPLIYDAAFKTSWYDFKKEIKAISTLAVSLVFFTTVIVAVAAHYLIPGFTWPISFLLGAIVSPPDAVAATSIIKGLGLNKRVITIIEGESLVNDASALIAYRYALSAVVTGGFILWKASLQFLLVASGGVLAGLIVGYILVFAHRKIKDNAVVETGLSLLTPYLAYLLAENFHVSGILAVVTSGIYIAWFSREVFSFQTRLQTTVVWETVIFLLNGIIFILIGLQLPELVKDLKATTIYELVGYGLLISLVTMIIRIIWVFAGAYHPTIFKQKHEKEEDNESTSWKNVLIVAWTGTRGVVSLATALAVPFTISDGTELPKRHSILLLAFMVILVTLIVQGLTLPILIKLLKIKPENSAQQKEEDTLNLALSQSSLHFLNNNFPFDIDERIFDRIKKQYELNYNILSNKNADGHLKQQRKSRLDAISQFINAQLEMVKFQRDMLLKFHNDASFSEEALSKAERDLDIEELRLNSLKEKAEGSAVAATTNTVLPE